MYFGVINISNNVVDTRTASFQCVLYYTLGREGYKWNQIAQSYKAKMIILLILYRISDCRFYRHIYIFSFFFWGGEGGSKRNDCVFRCMFIAKKKLVVAILFVCFFFFYLTVRFKYNII